MDGIIFQRLDKKQHDRSSFDCQVQALNAFLCNMANQQQSKGLNSVYVAVNEIEEPPKKIYGYYAISANSLSFKNLPQEISDKMPKNYPIPTVKIARLAKDKMAPKGFGSTILGMALRHALELSKELGIVGVDVDAKNQKAKDFYLKFGFIPLKNLHTSLFLPIAVIKKLMSTIQAERSLEPV